MYLIDRIWVTRNHNPWTNFTRATKAGTAPFVLLKNRIPFYTDCSVCSEGYTASLGFVCTKCSDDIAGGITIAAVGSIIFVFVFIAFIIHMLSGMSKDADRGLVARVTSFIPLHTVKIIVVVWQIITQVSSNQVVL